MVDTVCSFDVYIRESSSYTAIPVCFVTVNIMKPGLTKPVYIERGQQVTQSCWSTVKEDKYLRMKFPCSLTIIILLVTIATCGAESACDLKSAEGFSIGGNWLIRTTGLREDLPIGSTVGSFDVWGPTDANLTAHDHDYLQLVNSSVVVLVRQLDAELMQNLDDLGIDCTVTGSSIVTNSEIVVKIPLIINVNEYPPTFTQNIYSVNVSEAAPLETEIFDFTGKATDRDSNSPISSYTSTDMQSKFELEEDGPLKLVGTLDYETQNVYTFHVTATDSDPNAGTDTKTATTVMIVYVKDFDDHNPKFVGAPYSAVLAENATVGFVVPVQKEIKAFDPDVGINSPILYSIENITGGEFFHIDSRSGVVTLKKHGLRRGQELTITIRATEEKNPDRSETATLTVMVTAVNENPPRFEYKNYVKTVMENMEVGTVIMDVRATDNDLIGLESQTLQGALLKYSISPPAVDKFEIHETEGTIKLIGSLDYEEVKQYTLNIAVTDGQFTDTATVVINVRDVNDNSPVFTKNMYEKSSQRKKGVIGTVSATDADGMSSEISYVLKTYTELFSIDSKTGAITLHGDPSNITQQVYMLTIEARDSGAFPRSSVAHYRVTFPLLPKTPISTVTPFESKQNEDGSLVVYILAGISGFLLIVCVILAILTAKLVRRRRSESEHTKISRRNPTEGLVYGTPGSRRNNLSISDFLDEGATTTQENPLALENPGYYYEDDDSDIHEGQLRRVDEIIVGETMHSHADSRKPKGAENGNKPMGSPTSSNSSTTSLIGALKKEDDTHPRKKKSLSWGKNQQEVYNAEAPIDPDASVRPMEEDDIENGKPKITLYF